MKNLFFIFGLIVMIFALNRLYIKQAQYRVPSATMAQVAMNQN